MHADMTLRPVAEDDLPLLRRLTNDPEGSAPFEWHGYQNPAQYQKWFDEHGYLDGRSGLLVVVRGPERLGLVSWHRVATSANSFCWSMGIAIVPEARGQGHGTLAQRLLVRYLFAHTHVNRIEAETEVDNLAEQRALEKAGFTREGVRRGAAFRGGRWRDRVTYSILREEVDLDGHT